MNRDHMSEQVASAVRARQRSQLHREAVRLYRSQIGMTSQTDITACNAEIRALRDQWRELCHDRDICSSFTVGGMSLA